MIAYSGLDSKLDPIEYPDEDCGRKDSDEFVVVDPVQRARAARSTGRLRRGFVNPQKSQALSGLVLSVTTRMQQVLQSVRRDDGGGVAAKSRCAGNLSGAIRWRRTVLSVFRQPTC
jgi:hypothetical protein